MDRAYPQALVQELQTWRLARESASRCNRNLLQYAAGLAAVLGISAGGGGMIAVASALQTKLGEDTGLLQLDTLVGSMVVATILTGLVLLVLLVGTFRHRQAAERLSDEHLTRLIALAPQWFQPRD
jgi:hypothetical protein